MCGAELEFQAAFLYFLIKKYLSITLANGNKSVNTKHFYPPALTSGNTTSRIIAVPESIFLSTRSHEREPIPPLT